MLGPQEYLRAFASQVNFKLSPRKQKAKALVYAVDVFQAMYRLLPVRNKQFISEVKQTVGLAIIPPLQGKGCTDIQIEGFRGCTGFTSSVDPQQCTVLFIEGPELTGNECLEQRATVSKRVSVAEYSKVCFVCWRVNC